jgi:hypothetical protein
MIVKINQTIKRMLLELLDPKQYRIFPENTRDRQAYVDYAEWLQKCATRGLPLSQALAPQYPIPELILHDTWKIVDQNWETADFCIRNEETFVTSAQNAGLFEWLSYNEMQLLRIIDISQIWKTWRNGYSPRTMLMDERFRNTSYRRYYEERLHIKPDLSTEFAELLSRPLAKTGSSSAHF